MPQVLPRGQKAPDPEPEQDDDDALNVVATSRRSIMDLKLPPKQMAFVNNILVYTLFGLPVDEIAMQCSCSQETVLMVRGLEEYKRVYDALVDALRAAYAGSVQGILAAAAPNAARKMVKKMKDKSGDIALAAVKDVLDRTGHRPADRVEHVHSLADGELRIRVIKQSDNSIPTLDLTANA